MIHMAAFRESVASSGAWTKIAVVEDPAMYSIGDDLRAPINWTRVLGVGGRRASATNADDQSRIVSPYLFRRTPYFQPLLAAGADWGDPPRLDYHPMSPVMVAGNESINFEVDVADGGTAEVYEAVIWLSDSPIQKLDAAWITVGFTVADTASAGAWTNAAITFDYTLPYGDYRVGGLVLRGAGGTAGRLVLPGSPYRPGTIIRGQANSEYIGDLRMGRSGELARFNSNQPPSLDLLGAASVTDVHGFMDLVML